MDLAAGDRSARAETTGPGRSPAWSRDGRWIAFVANVGGSSTLYIKRPGVSKIIQVSPRGMTAENPEWLPSSDAIVFATGKPLRLAIGSFAMLLVLSLLRPAVSHAPADLTVAPHDLAFDWFYLLPYPLLDRGSPLLFWGVLVGSSLLLSLLPWLPPLRRAPAAVVDPGNCNGCGRCFADCPFSAVTMQPRNDGSRHTEIAVVDPALCTACGICAGACPSSTPFRSIEQLVSGIDMPAFPVRDMRSVSRAALETLQAPLKVLVYGCEHAVDVKACTGPGVAAVSLPCTGNLPPAFIEFALRREGADGVFITGCDVGDCFFRQGAAWTEARVAGQREPHLRGNVDGRRVRIAWGAAGDAARVRRELDAFVEELRGLDAAAREPAAHG